MSDKIKHFSGVSFAKVNAGTYALTGLDSDIFYPEMAKLAGDWERDPIVLGDVKIIPFGFDNNLPVQIRDLLEKNNLGPGILQRKTGLQYGQGPYLYQLKLENNEITKEWTEDAEIQAWLDTWDYRRFVRESLIEYNHMSGFFVKYILEKGRRLGQHPVVKRMVCLHNTDCRLEYPGKFKSLEDVVNIVMADFEDNQPRDAYKYPRYDLTNPGKHGVSIDYHSLRSFAHRMYSVPSFLGTIPWVKRANDLPDIIAYLTENMIAAAYHVHEPAEYWEEKRNILIQMNPEADEAFIAVQLGKLRDELTETIAKVLSGKKNTGKFFESIDFTDPESGERCEWKIEPIEMNIDKFVDAQTKISRLADSSTTSGFGLNPALSNIIIDGKGDSGSQMIYALKIFYAADTQIAEDIVFEPINRALQLNFPNKKLAMGLYRQAVNKENNVSAGNRMTNNI